MSGFPPLKLLLYALFQKNLEQGLIRDITLVGQDLQLGRRQLGTGMRT